MAEVGVVEDARDAIGRDADGVGEDRVSGACLQDRYDRHARPHLLRDLLDRAQHVVVAAHPGEVVGPAPAVHGEAAVLASDLGDFILVGGVEIHFSRQVAVEPSRRVGQVIARDGVIFHEELRKELRKGGFLTRDARIKESKKYGRKKARRGFQFVKR